MNYELSIFLRQTWHDHVLEGILANLTKTDLRNTAILLDPQMADKGHVQIQSDRKIIVINASNMRGDKRPPSYVTSI